MFINNLLMVQYCVMNVCSESNCETKLLARGLCSKHYWRLMRGYPDKTRFDRRPAVIEGGYIKLELGNQRGYTIVDKNFTHLDKHNWSLDGRGYPSTWHNKKVVKIHHMIIGKPLKGLVVDHINRDKLDNRISNLRFVTQHENVLNSDNAIKKNWKVNNVERS